MVLKSHGLLSKKGEHAAFLYSEGSFEPGRVFE